MKVLQDYLDMAGISQADLAKRANMDPSVLNHFLKGKREPRVANLRKLSEATGISVERLVASVPQQPKSAHRRSGKPTAHELGK